jgi:hypothetical protein
MERIMKKTKEDFSYKKQGFALLYAIVVSSIILAIALGVSNIALKEVMFSTSAKDANEAFYAADTASECALYYDNSSLVTNAYFGSSPDTTSCNGKSFSVGSPIAGGTYDMIWTFKISQLSTSGKACAIVNVEKNELNTETRITSIGYNNGGGTLGDCVPTINSVQRVIELNYSQTP